MPEVVTESQPSSDYLAVEMVVTARCVDCGNTDCEHALATARRIGDELVRYARLKDAVCEAAKAMRKAEREADEGRNTLVRTDALINFGKQRERLNAALDDLIEFESSQQQATSAPPVE